MSGGHALLQAIARETGRFCLGGHDAMQTAAGRRLPDAVPDTVDDAALVTVAGAAFDAGIADAANPDAAETAALAATIAAVFAAVADYAQDAAPHAAEPDMQAALDALPRRVAEHAVAVLLLVESQPAFLLLMAAGVIAQKRHEDPDLAYSIDRFTLDTDALGRLLTDPLDALGTPFGWGGAGFDPMPLFEALEELAPERADVVARIDGGTPVFEGASLSIARDDAAQPPGLAVTWRDGLGWGEGWQRAFGRSGLLTLDAGAALTGAVTARIAPPLDVVLSAETAAAGRVALSVARAPEAGPLRLWGDDAAAIAARVDAPSASVALDLDARGPSELTVAPVARIAARGLTLRIGAGQGDGFLNDILAGVDLSPRIDATLRWSPGEGVTLDAGGGLETVIPLGLDLGPVELRELALRLAVGDGALLRLDAGIEAGLRLGPVAVVVQGVGASLVLDDAPGNSGGATPRADLRFRPPTGLGLSVSAGPVSGGGFLSFEPDRGRYAGVLALDVGPVAIGAVGLLETRLPDGDGFSLLLIVTGEFPPVQLGFGFTLDALGGLLGVHRTTDIDALRDGLRSRTLDSIMFPEDPVANAPKILRDVGTAFPAHRGQHVFGPMARLGWGTPPVLAAELGLALELDSPLRLVLLGKIRAGLPSLEIEPRIVQINMDILGILDFGRREASLDAVLFDSRVTLYTIEGAMALRLRWGADPFFALAIGGMHPAFDRPPALPDLDRVAISLGTGDNPQLRLEAFLALTSNTVQFGARLEARASAMGFVVEGWLGFDTLITLEPFAFLARIEAGVALKRGGATLMKVELDLKLTGPGPFEADGVARARIMLIEIEVAFSASFGSADRAALPRPDPGAVLAAALGAAGNWSADVPDVVARAVRLASRSRDAVLHPAGALAVRQQVLPLAQRIDLFAGVPLAAPRMWTVIGATVTAPDGTARALASDALDQVTEPFAPAQFVAMTDAEKLAAPSFETMQAGISGFGGGLWRVPDGTGIAPRDISRRTIHVGGDDDDAAPVEAALLDADAATGGAVPRAVRLQNVSLAEPRHVIATRRGLTVLRARDNGAFADIPELAAAGARTHAGATSALRAHLARHPEDRDALQVVALDELEAA